MSVTETEIAHGVSLLAEVGDWTGPAAVIPIDDRCKWGAPHDCGRRLVNVIVLLQKRAAIGTPVHAVGYCEHHTACMRAAIARWRVRS